MSPTSDGRPTTSPSYDGRSAPQCSPRPLRPYAFEAHGGPHILASIRRKKHGRSVAELENHPDPPDPPEGSDLAAIMAWRTSTAEGK